MRVTKKSVLILFVLICMLGIISCGRVEAQSKTTSEEVKPTELPEAVQASEAPASTESTAAPEQTPEEIAENPQIEEPEAEGCTVEANGYKIEVKSLSVEESYTGEDMLVVFALFTNNSTSTVRFWDFASVKISQNGTTIGDNVVFAGEKYMNATASVSPGQTIPIYIPFEMCDPGSMVDVKVTINNFATATVIASGTCTLPIS